jgi:hypothetical protein
MSFIITATFARPNTSVPFFEPSEEIANYIKTNYRQTGKILSSNVSFSSDGLSETHHVVWSSRPTYMAFIEDPQYMALMSARDAHLNQYGITMDVQRIFGDGETLGETS